MKEQLISFKVAKLAKEKYFNIDTHYAYSKYGLNDYEIKIYHSNVYQGPDPIYLAPTLSLLQKWLREVHNIIVVSVKVGEFGHADNAYSNNGYEYLIQLERDYAIRPDDDYNTYEEALEAGLLKALKLIEL